MLRVLGIYNFDPYLEERLGLIPAVDIHHSQGYVQGLIQLGCN